MPLTLQHLTAPISKIIMPSLRSIKKTVEKFYAWAGTIRTLRETKTATQRSSE